MYVNFLAVFACTVLAVVIGSVWFHPKVFGAEWIRLACPGGVPSNAGMTKKGMMKQYGMQIVASFLTAYVLAQFIVLANAYGLTEGIRVGFWVWLGFVAPIMLGGVLWEGKPWRLFFIAAGQYLVTFVVSGAILAIW